MFGLDDFDIKKTRFYEEVRQQQTLEVLMRLLIRRIGGVSQQL